MPQLAPLPDELEAATVEVRQQIEYGQASAPAAEFVRCSEDAVSLTSDATVDASQVGAQTLSVTLEEDGFTRSEDVELEVVDTTPPEVVLAADSLELEVGEPFDAPACVASVKDPVDGAFELVDEQPEPEGKKRGKEQFYDAGWYLLTDDVDTSVAGTYELDVVACDQHGNETRASLPITVIDPLEDVSVEPKPESTTIEYATTPVNPADLVTCSDKDASVSASPLVPDKVGETKADVTVSKQASSHDVSVTFDVCDTTPPKIVLAKKTVKLQMGDPFEVTDYITSVADPVDGELERVSKAPATKATDVGKEVFYDKGWYEVVGSADLNVSGAYKLKVVAHDRHGNTATKKLKVVVKDPLKGLKLTPKSTVLEYSKKKTDPVKLVSCSIEGATVTADKLSLKKLGKRTVTYTVTKGKSTHSVDVDFEVKDTKGPQISYKTADPVVEFGGRFDPYDNIEYVRDKVDGDLERCASEPSETGDGWYTIKGSYDPDRAGRYDYTVIACDRNGNRSTREMSLTVKQPETPASEGYDYVLNTNTGKFHHPNCRDVGKIKPYNRWDVHMTRDEVIGMGYAPCKHCYP